MIKAVTINEHMDLKGEICNGKWERVPNLSAYDGEVVLECATCGERYFNAQEHYDFETLKKLKVRDSPKSKEPLRQAVERWRKEDKDEKVPSVKTRFA